MRNLLAGHPGRAFEALRDSPIDTDAMGVGSYRHKVAGFALGSALGSLAGGLYAFQFHHLQPQVCTHECAGAGQPTFPIGRMVRWGRV